MNVKNLGWWVGGGAILAIFGVVLQFDPLKSVLIGLGFALLGLAKDWITARRKNAPRKTTR
jgi:hypothetical protein